MAIFTPVSITNNPTLAMRFIQASIANSISSLYIARMRVFTLTNYVNYCIFSSLSGEDEYRNLSHPYYDLFLATIHITSPPPFSSTSLSSEGIFLACANPSTPNTYTTYKLKRKKKNVAYIFSFLPIINHFIPSKGTLP